MFAAVGRDDALYKFTLPLRLGRARAALTAARDQARDVACGTAPVLTMAYIFDQHSWSREAVKGVAASYGVKVEV